MSLKNKLIASFLILVLLVAIAILGSGLIRQSRLSDSSREFAIEVVPLLLSGNPRYAAQEDLEDPIETTEPPSLAERIEGLAHPVLLQDQTVESLTKYLNVVTLNLGRMEVVRNIRGNSELPLFSPSGQSPSASYVLEVEFVGGTAQVEITMLLEQDEWLISAFTVESNLLAD